MSWPKVNNAINSTTSQFGANDWGNLISDYYNGIDVGLIDPSKKPVVGTLTTYKFEKLVLQDTDGSHTVTFSVDNISTGTARKIRFREQVTPYETDYALLEALPQTISNKGISGTTNSFSNIPSSALTDQALFVRTNAANIFTATQTIEKNTLTQLILYRTSSVINSSNLIQFDAQNSDTIRKTYAQLNVLSSGITPGAEFATFSLSLLQGGSITNMLSLVNSVLTFGASPSRVSFDPAGITSTRTITFPNSSGKLPLLEVANVFTTTQKIQYGFTAGLTLYRPDNTQGNATGINFSLQNDATPTPVETIYAAIYASNILNDFGAENGALAFYVRSGGVNAERMVLDHLNRLRIGLPSSGILLDPTGITSSSKVFTFPNYNGEVKVDGITSVQYKDGSCDFAHPSQIVGGGLLASLQGYYSTITQAHSLQGTGMSLATGTVPHTAAGWAIILNNGITRRSWNPTGFYRTALPALTSGDSRFYFGFTTKLGLLPSDNTPISTTESGVLIGYRSTDTEFKVFHNDGLGGGVTVLSLSPSVPVPAATTSYSFEIKMTSAGILCTVYNSGITVLGSILLTTGALPATTTNLNFQGLLYNPTGVNKGITPTKLYLRSDK